MPVCSKALSKFSKMPMILISAAVSVAILWIYYKLSNLQSKFASEIKDLRNSVMQLQVCAAKVGSGGSASNTDVCFVNEQTSCPIQFSQNQEDELSICSEAVNDILETVLAPSSNPQVTEEFEPQQSTVVEPVAQVAESVSGSEYTEADLKKHTLEELKALATKLGESTKGNKADLIQRILAKSK
jgi:hypothetical protein